jgi:hypothetical protein
MSQLANSAINKEIKQVAAGHVAAHFSAWRSRIAPALEVHSLFGERKGLKI